MTEGGVPGLPEGAVGTVLVSHAASDSTTKSTLASVNAELIASAYGAPDLTSRDTAVDPVRPNAHLLRGLVLFADGRPDEAEASLEEALRISPMYYDAQRELTMVLIARAKLQPASDLIKGLPDGEDNLVRMAASASICSVMGQKSKSDTDLAKLKQHGADIYALGIGSVYAFRGARDEAFAWYEKARLQKDTEFVSINVEPTNGTARVPAPFWPMMWHAAPMPCTHSLMPRSKSQD